MKVQDKLDFFSKTALKEAIEQKNKIDEEIEQEFENSVAKATELFRLQAKERIKNESFKVQQHKNKAIIKATKEAKRALIDTKNKLIDELFLKVEKHLSEYVKSEGYKEYLLDQIKKAAQDRSDVKVILMFDDMVYADEIKNRLGIVTEETEEKFIGGFKIYTMDGKGFRDFSFATRLAEEKSNFDFQGTSSTHL